MFWPFKRKSKPVVKKWVGPATTDWKVGDLAECIVPDEAWNRTGISVPFVFPTLGSKHFVTKVKIMNCFDKQFVCFGIGLVGFPYLYATDGFRKILLTDDSVDRKVDKKQPFLQEV
jgi:hypothetical protein